LTDQSQIDTLTENDLPSIQNKKIKIAGRDFTCFSRLKDVPDKSVALIIGSSGLDGKRFLEIVIQGGNASSNLNLKSGMMV
jgi:hypothetical protein